MNVMSWSEDKLSELVSFWNKELGADFPMREELFKQNSFDDVNVSYGASQIVLDEENNIIGFVVAKRWKEKIEVGMDQKRGWIQTILVDSKHRGKGIGTRLLKFAETKLKEQGINEVQLGGDPFHYFPGIPGEKEEAQKWFEANGFVKRMDSYDLINHLEKDYPLPNLDSVEFSLLKEEEKDDLIAFFHHSFPGRWEYETIKYFELDGDGREFIVLKRDNKIIGFCRINDANSPFIAQNVYWSPLFDTQVGGIGPLGIDEAEQKKGYGIAIVQAAIAYLQERNIETIIIDWTGFIDFYGKLNFEPWKKYGIYLKDL